MMIPQTGLDLSTLKYTHSNSVGRSTDLDSDLVPPFVNNPKDLGFFKSSHGLFYIIPTHGSTENGHPDMIRPSLFDHRFNHRRFLGHKFGGDPQPHGQRIPSLLAIQHYRVGY